MVLRSDLLELRVDLLARLHSLAGTQTTVGAQDLRVGNFTSAYAVSLLPRLVRAGLLEEQASGGMRGGIAYQVRTGVGERVEDALTMYLEALGRRGFVYERQTTGQALSSGTRMGHAIAET